MLLVDSNIIIYAIKPEYRYLLDTVFTQSICVSAITQLEVLGYHKLSMQDNVSFTNLFVKCPIEPVTNQVIQKAIELRQLKKMSLGDGLIAATAVLKGYEVVTHNMTDFDWIEGLEVTDPLIEL